jgi:hypothetical protein
MYFERLEAVKKFIEMEKEKQKKEGWHFSGLP